MSHADMGAYLLEMIWKWHNENEWTKKKRKKECHNSKQKEK